MNKQGFGFFITQSGSGEPILTELLDGVIPLPAAWTQPAWFIDPVSGNDRNDGTTASKPVKTWAEIVRRWGTTSPVLAQTTTFTWLSSWNPALGPDPVIFTPVIAGVVVTMQGVLGAGQRVHAGVIPGGGLTPKNRATPQLLQADLGFAATPGQLVHNTTVGKNSYASVYQNVAGTVFALTQPLAPAVLPLNPGSAPTEVDTWLAGDTFEVFAECTVNLVEVNPTVSAFDAVDGFPTPVQVFHLTGIPHDGIAGDDNFNLGTDVSVIESSFTSVVVGNTSGDDEATFLWNVFVGAGVLFSAPLNLFSYFFGGAIVQDPSFVSGVAPFNFDYDAIIKCAAVSVTIGQTQQVLDQFAPFVGLLYIDGIVAVQGAMKFAPVANFSNLAIVWGPGTLDGVGSARLAYVATHASTTFINGGGITLNGQAHGLWTVTTSDPSVVHHGGGALFITGATLDGLFPGGWQGFVINFGGACVTNQGTS